MAFFLFFPSFLTNACRLRPILSTSPYILPYTLYYIRANITRKRTCIVAGNPTRIRYMPPVGLVNGCHFIKTFKKASKYAQTPIKARTTARGDCKNGVCDSLNMQKITIKLGHHPCYA